ncbi:hypothetical protein BDM02DRAFT_3183154 [Thelephora ganbajun]|uniref:Uncharacterized protein n=1 Tax=Thelephora ganbajun TaxID=370292 RepID=A0ACB6ZU90_THEGA|nr:hypothetical protein BDM02DRAFT_3183154 [Thelephora ganbajun]
MIPDGTVSHDVTLIACGVFLWDYGMTLWFEFDFMRAKVKLRWPLIPYFLTRYLALGFAIGCLLFSVSRQPLNCDALYAGGNFLGKAAVASASVNLLVRAVTIWLFQWYIVLLLGVLVTGEIVLVGIGLWQRGFFATWSNELQSCVGSAGSQKKDLGVFAPYALCVDCIIVILTIIGLRNSNRKSGLAAVVLHQGLGFFFLVLFFQTFVTAVVFTPNNEVLVSIASVLCAMIVYDLVPIFPP